MSINSQTAKITLQVYYYNCIFMFVQLCFEKEKKTREFVVNCHPSILHC